MSFMEMRVWLVGYPVDGGDFRLELSAGQPETIPPGGFALRARGNIDGDPVGAWMTTNPGRTRLEFTVALTDADASGNQAGADAKRIACAGLKTTDDITIQPTGVLPAGYMIGAPSCTENGWVRVGFVRPQLAEGASHTIGLKVVAIR